MSESSLVVDDTVRVLVYLTDVNIRVLGQVVEQAFGEFLGAYNGILHTMIIQRTRWPPWGTCTIDQQKIL
jgi:hypothetical protein